MLNQNIKLTKMVNMMKKVALLFAFLFAVGFSNAQDLDITDDDLKAYYIIDLAKNSIVKTISPMVNDLIAKQEGMTGQRFKELQATKGDADKLAAVEAKEWEIKFLNLVTKQIDKKKKAASDVVKILAANALGSAKYKAIRAGLKEDADMKSRYDGVTASAL